MVVQRKAIEVLAEHPDDVAVEHRLPRPSRVAGEGALPAEVRTHSTMDRIAT